MREYSILYLSRESFFRHEETLIVVGDRVREREEGKKKISSAEVDALSPSD